MSRPWMPFYDGDWLRDTAHLDDSQERAYFRLVMFYWANKGLPNDERQLQRICGKHWHWWSKNVQILKEFFDVSDSNYWTHKRIDYELSKNEKFLQKQRMNGAKGIAKRWPKDPQGDRQTIARARVPQPQPIKEKEKEKGSLATALPEGALARPNGNGEAHERPAKLPAAPPWHPSQYRFLGSDNVLWVDGKPYRKG